MNELNTNSQGVDSLGAELRKQREIRQISLREIADATKISRRYLEALETDTHDVLPAPVFTRGFVREFARYIGLDPEEMADRYNAISGSEQSVIDGGDPESHAQPLPFIRIDRNLVVFAILLVAFSVVVWWVWSHMGSTPSEPIAEATSEAVESVVEPIVAEGEPVEPEVATEPEKLELAVTVLDDTWVILQVDGAQETNEVLRAGDVRSFSADNEFRFEVVGNAGGIALTLNGRPIPSLGERGRVVRNLVYDWDYLSTLREETTQDDA